MSVKKLWGDTGYFTHSQDLRPEDRQEGFRTYGRAWFYLWDIALDRSRTVFHVEWQWGARRPALTIQFSDTHLDDDAILFNICIPRLIGLYLGVSRAPWVRHLPGVRWQGWGEGRIPQPPGGNRELGIAWVDGYVFLYPWRDPDRAVLWNPTDWLLGRQKYSTEDVEQGACVVSMPEGDYPATYRIFDSTWQRPRWPWTKRLRRGDIEIEGGIPIPGKGENSWDCEDTTMDGLTCVATTAAALVEKMRVSVMQRRDRYGGRGWMPATLAGGKGEQ